MKFCILISKNSWLYKNKKKEVESLFKKKKIKIFNNPTQISSAYDICFVLSYYKIIHKKFLLKMTKFLVNHESNLPENRGFSPLYWQILQGKSKIVSTLFEIKSEKVDTGKFHLKKSYIYSKDLLYEEIKTKQFQNAIDMIRSFLLKKNFKAPKAIKTNFLKKRNPKDSKLNINKTIKSQFNLLRISDNENFPAYFRYLNNEYCIKIYKKNNN